jgi:hypothetical protein
MVKKFLGSGLLIIVLLFGFSVISCGNGGDDADMVGTWERVLNRADAITWIIDEEGHHNSKTLTEEEAGTQLDDMMEKHSLSFPLLTHRAVFEANGKFSWYDLGTGFDWMPTDTGEMFLAWGGTYTTSGNNLNVKADYDIGSKGIFGSVSEDVLTVSYFVTYNNRKIPVILTKK